MPRIFLPVFPVTDNRIVITGEKAHYLFSVLRCKKSDELTIVNDRGACFKVTIVTVEKREIIAEVTEEFPCDSESPLHITLVQAILKGEKMDMVIQKTTELGVREIVPVITERSQVRETRKIMRWRKIAEEASRQSGRSVVPVVHEPLDYRRLFADAFIQNNPHGIIFYEEGGMGLSEAASSFIPHPSSFFVVVGPEGGFAKEEVALAKEKGFQVVSLGKRILRAETAALSAVTLVQFVLGDMG
jgi:16S rRNA (uracil1498-N3)-methyltransferase